jgi:hypothetical protein
MKKVKWFQRSFSFGMSVGMLPFYLERLSGTAARMEEKVLNVADEILSLKLDGKWSAKENIAHLAEVDEIALKRIDEMVSGISPMSPAVIQPSRNYNAQPTREIIQYFRENRAKNLERYAKLSQGDLIKSSLHPRLNVQMNPVDLAYFDAEHDDHHLVRINEILSQLQNKS